MQYDFFKYLTFLFVNKIFNAEGTAQGIRIPKRPPSPIIKEAQKHVRYRLENKWLPMYTETSEFKQRRLAVKFNNDKKKVCRKSNIYMFSYNLTYI